MKKFTLLFSLLIALYLFSGCNQKANNENIQPQPKDKATLEKEIELRIREYENHLRNGDSIALGNMYTEDAEIIPSVVGRENIIKTFGANIRNNITGSSFKTNHLWGNEQLLVEDGTGAWYYTDGTLVGSGRYLLVWVKDDGEWKILRDTWFPDKKE